VIVEPEHVASPDDVLDVVVALVAAFVAADVLALLADVGDALVMAPVAIVVFGCSASHRPAPPTSTTATAITATIRPVFDFFGGAGGSPPVGLHAPGVCPYGF
jgi:hypothetical protein